MSCTENNDEVKPKRGRPKGSKDKTKRASKPTGQLRGITAMNEPVMPEGYNAKNVRFVMECMNDRMKDLNDVDEMERRFMHYLEMCEKYDKKPGNLGAYACIGVDMKMAHQWATEPNPMNPRKSEFFKKVMQICSMTREALMSDSKVNPVVGIFWQKNFDHLKDQTETIITPNNPLGDGLTKEQLSARYLDNSFGQVEGDEMVAIEEKPVACSELASDFMPKPVQVEEK